MMMMVVVLAIMVMIKLRRRDFLLGILLLEPCILLMYA
jgi:hypothetical protein